MPLRSVTSRDLLPPINKSQSIRSIIKFTNSKKMEFKRQLAKSSTEIYHLILKLCLQQSAYRVFTPAAVFPLTGAKPKVKGEYIAIL